MSEKDKSQPPDDFSSNSMRKILGVGSSVQTGNEHSSAKEDSTQVEEAGEEEDSFKDYESALSIIDRDSLKTDSFVLADLDQPSTSKGTTKGLSRGIYAHNQSNINLLLSGSFSISKASQLTRSMNSLSLCAVTSQSEFIQENASLFNLPPLPQRKRFALAAAAKKTLKDNQSKANYNKDSSTHIHTIESPSNSNSKVPEQNTEYVPLKSGGILSVLVDVHDSHDRQEDSSSDQQTPITHYDQVVGAFLNQAEQVLSSSLGNTVRDTAITDVHSANPASCLHSVKSETYLQFLCIETEGEGQESLVSLSDSFSTNRDSQNELFVGQTSPNTEESSNRESVELPFPVLTKRRHSF